MLTATVLATDADKDPITYIYIWTNVSTGKIVRTTNTTNPTDTLDLSLPGNGDLGQTIQVVVTANDGTANGTYPPVQTVVVHTPPSVAVTLTPTTPTTNSLLTATATASDADGSPVTLTYEWEKNGVPIPGTLTTTPILTTPNFTATLDLSLSGNGDKNDIITFAVVGNDSFSNFSIGKRRDGEHLGDHRRLASGRDRHSHAVEPDGHADAHRHRHRFRRRRRSGHADVRLDQERCRDPRDHADHHQPDRNAQPERDRGTTQRP